MSSEEVSNLEEGLKNKPARNENKQAKQEIINRLAKAVESEENNITGEAIKSVAKSNFGTGNLAKLDLEQLEELEQIFLFETYFGDEEETEENKVVDVEAEVVENDEENFGAEVERAVAEG
jgi:hypothetical protein